MIVVDNTVLIDFWMGEDTYSERAGKLYAFDNEWIAPDLWRYEFGNILGKYQRLDLFSENSSMKAWDQTLQIMHTVHEIDVFAVDKIAKESDLTFYDASYVWLAQNRGLNLYTRDKKILRNCPEVALAMPE